MLHQLVLSTNSNETFERFVALEESDRGAIEEHGNYLEVGGTLTIDLFDAFDNDEYASVTNASRNGTDFYWQRSLNGSGVQLMPNSGVSWSENDLQNAPKVEYKVEFTTPGTYYAFLFGSCPDASSDSVFLALDNGTPVPLTRMTTSHGLGRWLTGDTWTITVEEAGVHTITLYAREDGLVFHKLYLTQDADAKAGALDPAISPRSLDSNLNADYVYLAAGDLGGGYSFTAPQTGEYTVYAGGTVSESGSISVSVGNAFTKSASQSGWTMLGTLSLTAGQTYEVKAELASAQLTGVYLLANSAAQRTSQETLVFGDSYTDTLFWKDFYTQLADIGARTIGISGSHVDTWTSRVEDLALYNPKNIVIHIGVNDINGGESAESCSNAIIGMLEDIRALLPDTNIFYITICDNVRFENKWDVYAQSNAAVKAYAETEENVYIIDYAALVDEMDEKWDNRGFLADNLHPSLEAYEALSELVVESVQAVYELDTAVETYSKQLTDKYAEDYESAERVQQAYLNGLNALNLAKTADAAKAAYEAALAAMQTAYESQVLVEVTYKGPFGDVINKVSGVFDKGEGYSFTSPTYLGLTADQPLVEGTAESDASFTVTYTAAGTDAAYTDKNGETIADDTCVPAYNEENNTDNDFLYTTGTSAFVFGNAGVTGDFSATLYLNTKFENPSNSGGASNARSARFFLVDAANDENYWSFTFIYNHALAGGTKLGVANNTRKTESTIPNENTAIALMKNSDVYLTIVREGTDVRWQAIVIGGEGTGYEGQVFTTTCTLPGVTAEGLKIALSNVAYAEYTVYDLATSRETQPKLTVNYVDEWGNTLSTYSQSYASGGAYRVESPAYLGYTADKEVVEGTLTDDTSVTVKYTFGGTEQIKHFNNQGTEIPYGTKVEAYNGVNDGTNWDHTGNTFKTYVGSTEGFTGDFAITLRINSKFIACENKTTMDNNSTARLYLTDAANTTNYWLFSFPYSYRASGGNKLGCTGSKYENEKPVEESVAKQFFLDCNVTLTIVREGNSVKWQAIVIGGEGSARAGESYVMTCELPGVTAKSIQIALTNRAYCEYTVSSIWKK